MLGKTLEAMHTNGIVLLLACSCVGIGTSGSAHAQEAQVLGFSDINYLATEGTGADGFRLGQLVGHVAAGLTDHLAFFGEVSATPRPTEFGVEVERLMVRYEVGDHLKFSAGRYHTPLGFWNTAYHHGLWLQTSVARPEMIKFGSRFIPVHFVGLQVEGSFPKTNLVPGYFFGVGNGRHDNVARAGDAGDVNRHRAWLAGVNLRPAAVFGLMIGASAYRDRIAADVGAVDETIISGHLALQTETPELIVEYAHIIHTPDRSGADATTSDGYYVQVAYRLPSPFEILKPYARWEEITTDRGDPVFGTSGLDHQAFVAGLRYDFAMLAALKIEYRNERMVTSDRFHSLALQLSFVFPNQYSGH